MVAGAAVVEVIVLLAVALTFVRSITGVCSAGVGLPSAPVAGLNAPVETAAEKPAALVDVSGTVAVNVQLILVPLTLPLTLVTGSSVTVRLPLSKSVEKNWTLPLLFAQT